VTAHSIAESLLRGHAHHPGGGHALGRFPNWQLPLPPRRETETYNPLPVAPADVPASAVRAVKRMLLRSGHPGIEDPMDDELARLVVAVVIAALHDYGTTRRKSPGRWRGEPAGMTALF
jgi:hypothetical protein